MPVDADRIKQAYLRGAFKGLVAAAEDLLARSIADAPVEEGTLRESAVIAYIVSGRRFEGGGAAAQALAYAIELLGAHAPLRVDAEVSFNTVYAAAQHEGIAFMVRSDTGTPYLWQARDYPGGGGPKYLEKNLLAHGERYQRVIAAGAKKGIDDATR